ncbi:cyclic nucleotide-binding domain-containing protein [Fontimonas sp. SYSU GA230001]|uniref:Crp/Fnr family transcriptional regulator n=1 Tax=Fontimonas sp. SYSU GA230001 TaxID=3142450 RepID=UPI0032B60F0C
MNDVASEPAWTAALRASPIVQDLPDEVLATMVRRGRTLELQRADPLLVQDVRGGLGLFILLSGTIAIYRRVEDDLDGEQLSVLRPGDCVGEYSLLDGLPLSATARALEAVQLFFLPNAQFRALTEADPRAGCILYRNLARHLVRRLRAL